MRKTLLSLAGAALVMMLAACGGGSSNQGVTDALGSGGGGSGSSACATCLAPSSTGTTVAGNTNVNASAISVAGTAVPDNNRIGSTLAVPNANGVNLQLPNANGVYTMDVASGSLTTNGGLIDVVNTSPQTGATANTVTLETDAQGNLFSVQFNITNNTSVVSGQHLGEFVQGPVAPVYNTATADYDGVGGTGNTGAPLVAWGGSPSATTPAAFFTVAYNVFSGINISGGSSNFVFSTLTGIGTNLTAGAYGMWMNNAGGGLGGLGVFALGNTALVPGAQHGTATLNGQTIGAVSTTNSGAAANLMLLSGTVLLQVDFDHSTVGTTLSNFATKDLSSGSILTNPLPATLTGTATISGASYQGSLTGGGYTGAIKGGFLAGTGGTVESVGTWNASNSTSSAIGAFGAK